MRLLMIIICFSLPGIMFAQTNSIVSEKFQKANDLYRSGKYNKSIEVYKQIEDNGYNSPELFYNLGNACFKAGDLPGSILYYERAKKLAPEDQDIDFNLKIANLRIVDKIKPVPEFFLYKWIDSIGSMIDSDSWSLAAVIFSWSAFVFLTGFYLIYYPFTKKLLFAFAIFFFVLSSVSFIFARGEHISAIDKNSAIIFQPSVYVKSSPDTDGNNLFILHEGTKVKILDKVNDWRKIKLADGNIGWLPSNTIEII